MHLLVVAAIAAEAAYVPDDLEVLVTGVGKTLAAVAVTRAICEHPRREDLVVVNIGTAGALREDVQGLHEIGTVLNHDLSAQAIRQLGIDPRERLELDPSLPTRLASGDLFVSDPVVRDDLATRADLVDMEGYAIALTCTELGVPVHLVKRVSDNADETAHDWSAAVDGCAVDLGRWLREFTGKSSLAQDVQADMTQASTDLYGFERYERAKRYFDDASYTDAARELEEFFSDLAAARADSAQDPIGHGTAEMHLLLARAYFHSAQLTRAEAAAREVLAQAPDDAYANLLLGSTLQRAGRGDEARGPLRLAELLGGYTTSAAPKADVSDEGF